jgi:hypothetical protein
MVTTHIVTFRKQLCHFVHVDLSAILGRSIRGRHIYQAHGVRHFAPPNAIVSIITLLPLGFHEWFSRTGGLGNGLAQTTAESVNDRKKRPFQRLSSRHRAAEDSRKAAISLLWRELR